MRIHHLNCGSMRTIEATYAGPPPAPVVSHCLLVETDSAGLVLVESGLGTGDVHDPEGSLDAGWIADCAPALAAGETAVRQVERLGFAAADVRHVVLTHLDVDHSGGLPDFPDAAVRRIVLLSSQGVGTRRHPPELEDAVRASGLEWTVLRPGGFHSNAFQWAEQVHARRSVAAPFGDVALPVIDPADIAEVAAVVLRDPSHAGGIYVLTGPAPVSPREQTAALGDALGEPVRFVEQSAAEARAQLLRFMPEPVVAATLGILGDPLPAERRVSPDVERLLGRPSATFADWARRNVGAFR